ncbi:unnamed protein product [Vitrella brassicaformis CCMP3155]|uniref:Uncharacterized protein n=1 Tax=Vitrella brassicaformis (strain CCMP3155) TaxID=1169540 RepID=A0A0G4EUU3_VITBC|nr:unnamed protein product [Vitrella brassicaformis CCMP3155]|eukprot:CEM02224.1 unnamed protein product [Vitrella brassicaformis CCMP3155]
MVRQPNPDTPVCVTPGCKRRVKVYPRGRTQPTKCPMCLYGQCTSPGCTNPAASFKTKVCLTCAKKRKKQEEKQVDKQEEKPKMRGKTKVQAFVDEYPSVCQEKCDEMGIVASYDNMLKAARALLKGDHTDEGDERAMAAGRKAALSKITNEREKQAYRAANPDKVLMYHNNSVHHNALKRKQEIANKKVSESSLEVDGLEIVETGGKNEKAGVKKLKSTHNEAELT